MKGYKMKRKQVPDVKVVRARELLRPFTKASFLQKLQEKMTEIDALQKMSYGNESFQLWRNSAETLLVHALGDEVAQTVEFKAISYWPPLIVSGMAESVYQESYESGLQRARTALQSIYDEVQEYFDDQNIEQKQVVERQTLPLGKEVFVYALSRSESVRLTTAYQNLRQISKLPAPADCNFTVEDLRK